ncbi:carboxypeptidase-like regulatory domain-containing protein [Flavobacterium ponti]|uniref:Carboxypeptidase-like regulatory domain-containing protein n=1 Tax=Flavobacterium ponti TaxID=665133 RepID=A0ABV9NZR0_9FLAO
MKKILFICILAFSINAMSQNIRFEGTVKDTTGVALEMANIMAINNNTKAMDAYAITNDAGKYQLNLNANTPYTLKISYIGYESQEKQVTTSDKAMNYNIILKEGNLLKEVELVYEMPVSISGDTIIYNSDSFTNGTERKLEDVLKKLPGVEVDNDGNITVEGKSVQKVMVEGKDFFDGDTKIATKNIPANALDKIQVLRNYNEVTNLKGLENNEENVALNIKLKEGKKNFWFGDITAGAGAWDTEDRYLVNPKLFYYNPKISINVISNFNNIGELPLTTRDYFRFTGGFKNMMRKGGSNFNVSSNDLGIGNLNNNQAANIDTKFGAANFSYNPTKALTFSGFGIVLGNKTQTITNTATERPEPLQDETRQDVSNQLSTQTLLKLSTSYVPSDKLHIDYDALVKFSDQREDQTLFSSLLSDINTNKTQNPLSVNQNFNYYYTLNDKNVFAFELQHLYQEEDPFYNANLEFQPFLFSGYDGTQVRNNLNQNRFVKTNKSDAKFDYYYMLTPKSNINLTLGNTYSYQNFDSSIFQILDNGTTNDLTAAENTNNVDYAFNDVFLGLHYKFIKGKFTVTPGFSVHNYSTKDNQLGTSNSMNFTRLLPDVYALYQIKKSETLTYNFTLQNNFTDITKLAEGYVFSNYNSLFSGNRNLENSLSQSHSLRYFKYNMFNFENIFGFLNYTKQVDAIKSRALLSASGANQASSSVNIGSNFADETISGAFNYGRSFAKYYKASAGLNMNWSKFNNIRVFQDSDADPNNNPSEIQTTESFTQSYNVKFSTNYKTIPNLSLGYGYTINDNFSDTFYTDSPTIGLEYYFLDAFSFVSDYSFYHNRNKDKSIDTEYDFLSASLIYQKKDSKWEYKLSGTNLLETRALNSNSFNQIAGTSTFSSYTVQPRYIILSLKYNL